HTIMIFVLAVIWIWSANHLLTAVDRLLGHHEPGLNYKSIANSVRTIWHLLTFSVPKPAWLVSVPMYYSGFLSVVWLLLYAAASPLTRLANQIEPSVTLVRRSLKRDKPFHAFAIFVLVAWTFLYLFLVLPLAYFLE